MTPPLRDRSAASLDALFRSLTTDRRREIVRLVADRPGITRDDLAHQLAAATTDSRPIAVTDDAYQRARTSLHHRDLPVLIDAGLLEETDGIVRTTDRWVIDESAFGTLSTDGTSDELDRIFEALANARRWTVLSVLESRDAPLSARSLGQSALAKSDRSHDRSRPLASTGCSSRSSTATSRCSMTPASSRTTKPRIGSPPRAIPCFGPSVSSRDAIRTRILPPRSTSARRSAGSSGPVTDAGPVRDRHRKTAERTGDSLSSGRSDRRR